MIKYPLIFTSIDGSLLDYFSYSFEPAARLLSCLSQRDIPVIANTSKTLAELVRIRKRMDNRDPFIVENGAAVYLPKQQFSQCPEGCTDDEDCWRYSVARPREHWLGLMDQFDNAFKALFTGFSAMSNEQIAEFTGLPPEEAQYAAQCQFSEPLLWHGSEEEKMLFVETIETWGGYVHEGGRFLHVGDLFSKAAAMQWLCKCYEQRFPGRQFQIFALGDSPSDIDMLESADFAVIVASTANPPPTLERTERLVTTRKYGPEGWNEAVMTLLKIPESALPE